MGFTPKVGDAFIREQASYENTHLYLTYEKDGVLTAYYYQPPEKPNDIRFIETPVEKLDGPFFSKFFCLCFTR